MASDNGDGSEPDLGGDPSNLRWEGYSTYAEVASQIAQIINEAVDAYAKVDSRIQEGATLQKNEAAEARQKILRAAMTLLPELRRDETTGDEVDEIVTRWEGDEDEEGYVKRLSQTSLRGEVPGWLFQFVIDIRTAGWELGYLKAGRTVQDEDKTSAEQEATSMFEK